MGSILNLYNIKKDTDVKFKYLDTLIAEWQNPMESNIKIIALQFKQINWSHFFEENFN